MPLNLSINHSVFISKKSERNEVGYFLALV